MTLTLLVMRLQSGIPAKAIAYLVNHGPCDLQSRASLCKGFFGGGPREARDLISKIRSCTVRSDLKNKQKTAENALFIISDLTVQDRILEIRSLASLGDKRATTNVQNGLVFPFCCYSLFGLFSSL